ncbi:unnamed protein product, partial [Mesorhabditis spiculigera]
MRYWLIVFLVGAASAVPIFPRDEQALNETPRPSFALAEKEAAGVEKVPISQGDGSSGGIMKFVESVANHPVLAKVWKFVEEAVKPTTTPSQVVAANQDNRPRSVARAVPTSKVRKLPAGRFVQDDAERFEASLSKDDSAVSLQQDVKPGASGKITDQVWSKQLFGERGVLTEIFHLMDEQRRAAEANAPHEAGKQADSSQQSDSSPKIGANGKFDLAKIFDQIFSGSAKGQLGDSEGTGGQLPEFFGLCNRLSCGDIYKAIDQFRKSEFFSNFQTGLHLIQDPKGWEIIGKALENPELISEFTGNSGLKEMFGSALGGGDGEKEKTAEKSKTQIMPEDGDFGTDFTDIADGLKPKNKVGEEPDVAFSIDEVKETSSGGNADYYSELTKTKEEVVVDHVDVDTVVEPVVQKRDEAVPASRAIEKSDGGLPELSFSVDEDENGESLVIEKSIDVAPPKKDISIPIPKTTPRPLQQRVIRVTNSTVPLKISKLTTKWVPPTSTSPATTRRNFRKDNDYYSMYYDSG